MKLTHWLRKENTGLAHTTLELIEEEQRQGHLVRVQEPSVDTPLFSQFDGDPEVHCIHSQLHPSTYHDNIPKVMWMHGEPLGSVGNGVSMRAIVDLAPLCDAFICMRAEEQPIWQSIKRTYLVPKGIDLHRFHPMDVPDRLEGEPAVIYYENWRKTRNPLILCRAMEDVVKVLPKARLHLFNCPGGKMAETFQVLIPHCRWYTFVRTLKGPQPDSNALLNRGDIVVSCLSPLYARGIEAFGAGKAFIGPGYKEHDYPFQCDLNPASMAAAIIKCWREYGSVNYRQWAETHHNVVDTVKASVEVYGRYL